MEKRTHDGHAIVTHVVPREVAAQGGVMIGDEVVGVGGHPMPIYDTIMSWLQVSEGHPKLKL